MADVASGNKILGSLNSDEDPATLGDVMKAMKGRAGIPAKRPVLYLQQADGEPGQSQYESFRGNAVRGQFDLITINIKGSAEVLLV